MVTKEEIATCFQELNIVVNDKVLEKCLEMCLNYNIGADDFCDQWYAYTASNLNGVEPTIEHLEKLERKELQKGKDPSFSNRTTPYKVVDDLDANPIVTSYTATTPKSSRTLNHQVLVHAENNGSTQLKDSYNNASPSVTQSEKYSQRSDSRSVQCYYGTPTVQFKRDKDIPITVISSINEEQILNNNFKYMYEIMGKKAKSLNNMTQWLGHTILEKHGLSLTEGTLQSYLGEMTTYGRIVSDSDGKINAQSVLLEGSHESNLGNAVTLNLNKLTKFSLFPGQVAVVQGNNLNSTTFIAEKIFTDSPLSFPAEPPVTQGNRFIVAGNVMQNTSGGVLDPMGIWNTQLYLTYSISPTGDPTYWPTDCKNKSDSMQIVVASGPFTLQSNLAYDPLNDLLKYVSEYKPHVLILVGPFLERNHEGIHNGSLTQTFDSFFGGLIENIMNSLQDVQVIIVSSNKDAHHHPVYPTPPYNTREKYNNLTFVSDPCMININGLVIGATSADILFHISNFEIYQNKNPQGPTDRMGRIASHLLNQQSFYPLYPAHKEMCMDHELFEQFGVLESKPHILILPSNLRHFIKNIQECLVINPEHLTKGYAAGTFARIEVNPGSSLSVCNRIACQIIRV